MDHERKGHHHGRRGGVESCSPARKGGKPAQDFRQRPLTGAPTSPAVLARFTPETGFDRYACNSAFHTSMTDARKDTPLDPQEYRNSNEVVPEARLVSAKLQIELFPKARRAKYAYSCRVDTVGEAVSEEWHFDIASDRADIQHVRAWDSEGGLQHDLSAIDGKGSRLRVRFRNRVRSGTPYEFGYEYVMPTTSIIAKGAFEETIAFLGWSIFLMHCNVLRVELTLPARSTPIETVPAPAGRATEKGITRLRYERDNLRPLESYLLLVGYRRMQLGAPAFLWVAGAIGTGLIGAVIAAAFGLN